MSNSKVVLITGVSSGIGRATAIKFATQRCRVFGTVRNKEKVKAIPSVTLIELDSGGHSMGLASGDKSHSTSQVAP